MRRTALILSLVLALGVSLVGHAWASAPDGTRQQWQERRSQHFQQWLGLTDEQMTQIQAIRQRDAAVKKQIGGSLRQAQAELRQLALNGDDPAVIQAKQTDVQQLLGQMVQLRVNSLREMAPLLTQEQRDKLAKSPMGHGGHGRHRQGPPPSRS